MKGGDVAEELDKYEIEECHKKVEDYISSNDPGDSIILADRLKINECFYHFRNLYRKGGFNARKPLQN